MSDYISKSALMKYLRDYKWEFALGSDFSKAIEMVDMQPTLDEKEIIRKPFERVVERLEECKKTHEKRLFSTKLKPHEKIKEVRLAGCYINAIRIVKEECGINE